MIVAVEEERKLGGEGGKRPRIVLYRGLKRRTGGCECGPDDLVRRAAPALKMPKDPA